MPKWCPAILASAVVLSGLSNASGQTTTADRANIRKAILADPSSTAFAQPANQQLTLVSSEDGSDVVARIGYLAKGWLLNLKFQAPVDKQVEVALLTDDGFTNKTTSTLSVTREFYPEWSNSKKDRLGGVCTRHNLDVFEKLAVNRSGSKEGWEPLSTSQCKVDDAKPATLLALPLLQRGPTWQRRVLDARQEALNKVCETNNALRPDALVAPAGLVGSSELVGPDQAYKAVCGFDQLFGDDGLLGTDWIPWPMGTSAGKPGKWKDLYLKELNTRLARICREFNDPASVESVDATLVHDPSECSTQTLAEKSPKLGLMALRAMSVNPFYLTAEAVAAESDFSWIDPEMMFEEQKTSETNTSYGLALGHLRRGVFYSLGWRKQTVFKGAPSVELCTPLGDTIATTCRNTALAGPARTKTDLYQADIRAYVSPRVALNLRAIHDEVSKDWEYHLLSYFLQHEKKGLNGGVDIRYSEKKDWQARLFIGVSFELIPN